MIEIPEFHKYKLPHITDFTFKNLFQSKLQEMLRVKLYLGNPRENKGINFTYLNLK